ncbi:MAG: hypothetical protein HOA66_08750, partial [Candidatus Marinimicrobia bacterium]|nr:hypothetical protein [Candidatus Neomarinimicrobiota bacterium]
AANNIIDTAIDDFQFNLLSGRDVADGCDLPVDNILLNSDGSVVYNSSSDIGGFQFNVDGATVNSATGGDAGAAGMMISASGDMVLAFSMTGSTFGPCGTMINLDLSGEAAGFSAFTFSDVSGNAIDFTYYDESDGICEDMNACNYGDDGDCNYAEENYDCEGNCTACVYDDGICGSPQYEDLNGDWCCDNQIDADGLCDYSSNDDDDGPPECLMDCPDFQTLFDFFELGEGDLTEDNLCEIFASWDGDDCLSDCSDVGDGDSDLEEITEIIGVCSECLAAGSCEGIFGDDGPPECMLDCENIEAITVDPAEVGQYNYCNGLAEFDQSCLSDCDQGTIDFVDMFVTQCEECIEQNNCECIFVEDPPEGCDDGGDDEADYVVEVGADGNSFSPADLQIEAGETVQWVNVSGFHNVDGSTDTYPNNPDSFYSGSASNDAWTYSYTFEVEGVYDYECTPHAPSMAGTITVSASNNNSCMNSDDCDGGLFCNMDLPDAGCESCSNFNMIQDCYNDGLPCSDSDGGGVQSCVEECFGGVFESCDFENEGAVGDEPNTLWLADNGDGTYDVGYWTTDPIGGFQFNVDGTTINSASGGDASAAGFMVSAAGTTALGFSLTGATIAPGDPSVLLTLDLAGMPTGLSNITISDASGSDLGFTYDDGSPPPPTCDDMAACNYGDEGDCEYAMENYDCDGNCTADLDCLGECGGMAMEDECGICDGDGSSCLGIDLSFSNVNTADGTMDIYMMNELALGGFQIDLSGLNITSASGGSATDAGFMLSASGSVILGFSMTGATVPVGEGALVSITFDSPTPEICFADAVMSDSAGAAITTTLGDCYSGTPGCMDDSACNYNMDATYDDGSCAYEYDCAGECGGMAMEDCAGECGGMAMEDCAGVCEGSSDYDCAGECNGTAVEDVCGACNGTETDPANCIADGFSLSLANVDLMGGTLDVVMNNSEPVAGFQFNINGINITGATGGSAEANAFMVSGSGSV